jgi:hypothetical protein
VQHQQALEPSPADQQQDGSARKKKKRRTRKKQVSIGSSIWKEYMKATPTIKLKMY